MTMIQDTTVKKAKPAAMAATISSTRARLSAFSWRWLACTACVMAVCAAEAMASGGGAAAAEAAPFDPTLPRPMDIGAFDLKNFRPTHNEIANIKFSLCVVFPAGTTNEEMAQLETWKRRLRDQAITAVRSASAESLNDSKLEKVRRLLLLRLRRMDLPKKVEAVYLTDFSVTSGAL